MPLPCAGKFRVLLGNADGLESRSSQCLLGAKVAQQSGAFDAVEAEILEVPENFFRMAAEAMPCAVGSKNPVPLQTHNFFLLDLEFLLRKNAAIQEVLQLLDHVDLFVQR